jgi:hypothetical protein
MAATIQPGSTAHEFTLRRFGRPVALRKRAVNVPTASVTTILNNNPRRLAWLIQNIGNNDLSVDFRETVDPATALLITRSGSTLSSDVQEDGESVAWALYGVANVAATTVVVIEIIAL